MKIRTSVRVLRGPLDVAPLVDVILLLLIFFLLTSTFVFQPGIVVDPPSPGQSKGGVSDTRYVVTATAGANPQIFFNDRATDLAKLRLELGQDRAAGGGDYPGGPGSSPWSGCANS